jgi:hypothetical protein
MVWRAHRPGETDWIAYTLDLEKACVFANKRSVDMVHAYQVNKADVLCLFTRRGEWEVLILDKAKVEHLGPVGIVWKYQPTTMQICA